jgi:hypothetical protein
MRIIAPVIGVVLLGLSAAAAGGQDQVEVKVVTYPQLGDIIRGFKGKVVVVDFWADT